MRTLALATLLLACTAFAQARRVATVGVAVGDASTSDAEWGAHAVAAFLQSDTRFEWVSPAVQTRDDGPVREAKALEAKRLFQEAREQLDNLQVPKAVASADKAIKFFEESDLSQGVGPLLDALALRALASLAKNDKGGFSNDAQRVLAINPDYAWDPGRVTPSVKAALEPLKKKAQKAAPVSLEIASTPEHAWLYVDGVFRGVTPATVPGLVPGSHVVDLVAAGYELTQESVFAGPGANPSFTLKPSRTSKDLLAKIGEVRAALDGGDLGGACASLLRFLQADEVLVAGVRIKDHKPQAVLVRVMADGQEVGRVERAFDKVSDWQGMAKELEAKEAPPPKQIEPPKKEPEQVHQILASPTAWRKPAGWILAAVAVASVGAGVGLGVTSQATAQKANKLPQIDTAGYNNLAGQAKLQAGLADGLFGLAVVSGAVSLFMLITGYSSDEAEEESFFLAPTPQGAAAGFQVRF